MLDEYNMSIEDRTRNRSHLVKAKVTNYLNEVKDSRKRKSQKLCCKKVSWQKYMYTQVYNAHVVRLLYIALSQIP